jgi:thiamine biosynthesis lipoprotein
MGAQPPTTATNLLEVQVFPEYDTPRGMVRNRFRAMGTTVEVLLPHESVASCAHRVRQLFDEWEASLSRFRPTSDLSRLNRTTGRPVLVSALLSAVLGAALDAAMATGGLYDPTLLAQLLELGYDRSFEQVPDVRPDRPHDPQPGGGWRRIQFNRAARVVTLPPGVAVDLGGIAKGMAVDAALRALQHEGVASAMISAGGDLGVLGLPPDASAWVLAVEGTASRPVVSLQRGAMATSGRTHRRWKIGQVERHHLIDPRTGEPAQSGLATATVVAGRCAQAEVAAKVAFLLGREEGARFLLERGVAGLLVDGEGTLVPVGAWPSESVAP